MRFTSLVPLFLVTLLCFGLASPVVAGPPWQGFATPSGLDVYDHQVRAIADDITTSFGPAMAIETASVTVANTTAATNLLDTTKIVGTFSIPSAWITTGRTFELYLAGVYGTTGTPTLAVAVKLGSSTILSATGTCGNNLTNRAWNLRDTFTFRLPGASGTVIGQGSIAMMGSASYAPDMSATSTTSVDTTDTQTVTVTVTWGAASSSNTITNAVGYLRMIN